MLLGKGIGTFGCAWRAGGRIYCEPNRAAASKLFKKLGSSVQYSQRNDLQNDLQNGGRPDARIGEFCAAPEKRDRPFIRASTSRPCGTSMQFVGWVSPSRYQGHDAI